MKHRRKKARRNVKPHGCLMCMMGAPKRMNGQRRLTHRDKKRMIEWIIDRGYLG